MARGQDNGITILLGVKDLKIGEVTEYEEKIVVKASLKKQKRNMPILWIGKPQGEQATFS